jgi:hypothetical protein
MRKIVGGKQMLTPDMITYMNEMDIISKDEAKALKALNYDEINNKFYYTKAYLGTDKGTGTGAKKISYAQAKAMFNFKLPSFSSLQSKGTSQTSAQGGKLIQDILTRKTTKAKFKK